MRRAVFLLALATFSCAGKQSPSSNPDTDAGNETTAPAGPLSLAAGEAAEVPMGEDGVARIRLGAPAGTEQYVVILGSTKLDKVTGTYPYTLALDPLQGETPAQKLEGCSINAADWNKSLPPSDPAPSGTAPAVGTKRKLETGGETIDAEVYAVSKTAVVWADVTTAHPATLDKDFVDAFLKDWDDVILPRERAVFGTESDLDKDGRIGLVFTPVTKATAVAYFSGCDLKELAGCGAGNKGEFLYLTPPADIDPPYNTPAAIKEILAHETGHLMHFNRKVLRNDLSDWSDSQYMAEGMGALAQDVIGFQAGNLYVTKAGLDQIDAFSLADVFKDRAKYDSKRDGSMRGGAYLFTRWLYDRAGGDLANPDGTITTKGGPTLLRALLDSKDSVATALGSVAKAQAADVTMDFYTALAMSNRTVAPKNGCFAYLPTVVDPITTKQRGADLFAEFHGQKMLGPKLQTTSAPTGTLRVGGVELVALNAKGAGELDLTVTTDPAAGPRLRIARIK